MSRYSHPESKAQFARVSPLVLIALCLVATPLAAQFANKFPPSGNTGVGTGNPTELLEVNGVTTNSDIQLKIHAATNHFGSQTYYENGILKWNIYFDFINDNLVYGNATGPKIAITPTGSFVIGAQTPMAGAKLHVEGDVFVSGNIAAKYQDIAEWVPATEKMEPGTVVVLNPEESNAVMPSTEAYDTTVAGVVSAKPGLILGEIGASKAQIATMGRVKVKVSAAAGAIEIGTLLVTSGKRGLAMKSEPIEIAGRKFHQPGTIIGKALEPLSAGEGDILVLLSLQ